jgi:hypothetical protein
MSLLHGASVVTRSLLSATRLGLFMMALDAIDRHFPFLGA